MRLALFEPDIPQNAGTMLRMAACLNVAVDLIGPCGFLLGDRHFRRAGLDYLSRVTLAQHPSWTAFQRARGSARLVALTTHASIAHTAFLFRDDDVLMVGRESSGLPDHVHAAADARIRIPLAEGVRSLNVAVAAAIVLGEALRQRGAFPEPGDRP